MGGRRVQDGNDGDQTPRWHMRAVTLMSSALTCENVVSEGLELTPGSCSRVVPRLAATLLT
jgi:hypothetical protein